jgi:pyruvate carboxylase subunit A
MQIYGIQTTRHYYKEILQHPEFRSGQFNTGFVEAHPELTQYSTKRRPEFLAAAIAAALAAQSGM